MNIDNLIYEYAGANTAAQPNAKLLIDSRHSEDATEICVARMKRLKAAETALKALDGQPNLPNVLQDYFDARNDDACSRCWLSPCAIYEHQECKEKIARWFKTRDELVAYGVKALEEQVHGALYIAEGNGYDMRTWSDDEIVTDIKNYEAGLEDVAEDLIRLHVITWKAQNKVQS
jgi:hypothetical protein